MDFYIGQIIMFGGNFAIRNMAMCGGQLMAISSNTALFSILGTTYGGDGRTTFALPDMRGRAPKGAGQSPGTSFWPLGARAGSEDQTLTILEMPVHTHAAVTSNMTLVVSTDEAQDHAPTSSSLPAAPGFSDGPSTQEVNGYASDITGTTPLAPGAVSGNVTIGQTGGSQPFSVVDPLQVINFEMVLFGIFPPRS